MQGGSPADLPAIKAIERDTSNRPQAGRQNPKELNPLEELPAFEQWFCRQLFEGHSRYDVARYLVKRRHARFLPPDGAKYNAGTERHVEYVAYRLRDLEYSAEVRNALWHMTMVWVDRHGQDIMAGVVRKAKTGRVDAAKFALEVAGRYTPRGDTQAAVVQVHIDGVPRPWENDGTTVEGEAEEIEE